MTLFLLSSFFALSATGSMFSKKSSEMTTSLFKQFIYFMLNGILAMFNFAVMNKFSLSFTPVHIIYGMLFGICVAFSVLTCLNVYKYVSVSFNIVFSGALTLVLNQIAGLVMFDENLLAADVIRCVLRMTSVLLIVSPGEIKHGIKCVKRGVLWCVLFSLADCSANIVTKLAAYQDRLNKNSWFFISNFFVVLLSVFCIIIYMKQKKVNIKAEISEFGLKGVGITAASTLNSNILSVVTVKLMAVVSLTFYSPVSGAVQMLAAFVISRFVLREAAGIKMYIAVALSLMAIII